jgi:heme-degrading monooxygenase HmoA
MHARLSRYAGLPPERIEETVRQFQEELVAQLERQQGFERITVAVDWNAGRAAVITYWDTEDNMRASEKHADELRGRVEAAGRPSREPIVDHYEVILDRQTDSG